MAVVPPRPVDRELLERMLGEPSLYVEHVDSPSMTELDDHLTQALGLA